MLNNIIKLGACYYLINNFLFSVTALNVYSKNIFLVLVCLFLFFMIIDAKITKDIIINKIFRFYFFANLINILYFITFDGFQLASFQYLAARFVGLTIFSISIYYNFNFYKKNFLKLIVYLIAAFALVSIFISPFSDSSDRYMGVVGNPNELGIMMSIGFGVLFNFTRFNHEFLKFKNILKILFACVFIFLILKSGSRGAILGVLLAIIIRFRFSFKSIMFCLLFCLMGYYIGEFSGKDTGINRFLKGDLIENRIDELGYAIKSFKNKFYSGYGLSQYSYIDQSLIDVDTKSSDLITAHNGYLAILVQYGMVFGFLFFLNLGIEFVSILKYYFNDHVRGRHVKVYLFFILYALLSSFFESIMAGINNILTSLFWFSFAYLSYYYSFYYKIEEKQV